MNRKVNLNNPVKVRHSTKIYLHTLLPWVKNVILSFTLLFSCSLLANVSEAELFAKGQLAPYRPVDINALPFSPIKTDAVPIEVVATSQLKSAVSSFKKTQSSEVFGVTIQWDAVEFAELYRLEERLKDTATWVTVYQGTAKSKILTGRVAGEYEYRVISCVINPSLPSTPLCESVADWSATANVTVGPTDGCQNCDNQIQQLKEVAEGYAFEPFYSGQRKSLNAILNDKAGNAVEIAGLYLSKIKALSANSAVDVKYVFGRIQIDVDKLISWLGVDSVETAAQIIGIGGGNPQIFTSQDGTPLYVKMDHVWTEVDGISVDPSFQVKSVPSVKNLQNDAGAMSSTVMDSLSTEGFFDNPDGILTPDLNRFDELLENNTVLTKQYLSTNPQLTYADYLATKTISVSNYKYGDVLPYRVLSSIKYAMTHTGTNPAVFDVLPTLKRERLIVKTNGLNHTLNMDEALDSSIVIDYVAATTADQTTIDGNGGLLNTPYQGVNLKPRLLINGQLVATGSAISVGSYHNITVEMLDGGESNNVCSSTNKEDCQDIVNHNVTVGGVHAIALDGQYIDGQSLEQEALALPALSQIYASNLLDSRFSGPLLSYLGRSYHRQLDIEVQNASASTGSLIFHGVNEAIISIDLTARLASDGTYKMSVGSRAIDAPRNMFAILPHQASSSYDPAPVLFALGQAASALEHAVFAKAMGWPAESTMSILRFAANHEQSIYVINQTNKASLVSQLNYPQAIIDNINTLVGQGRIIITPSGEQTINGWKGIGFIALDPQTGAAAFIINGGAAGGKQFIGALDKVQTNSLLSADTQNILQSISAGAGALFDGALYGTNSEILYDTPLEQNLAGGSAFITDFLFIGDVRNLGIATYDAVFNDGSLGNVGLASIAFFPMYDVAKGSYKIADNAFDLHGLNAVANTLEGITDASAVYLGNLTRHADVFGSSSFSLEGSVNTVVTSAGRNGMGFTSVVVQDANAFATSLSMKVSDLTTSKAKGEFGERAAVQWAKSNNLELYHVSSTTSDKGIDAIFRNKSTGEFIISESKWVSSNSNVGVGSLSNTSTGKQLSMDWIFTKNAQGTSALDRTTGLTNTQKDKIKAARQQGNLSTQLVVIKPKHGGAGITQKLTNDPKFGVDGSEKLGDIVIIEVPINP